MILGTFNSENIVALPNYGLRDLQMTANDQVSVAQSPFTKQSYTYNWMAQWWQAQLNLPAMNRASIAPWIAYLLELQGMGATTLLGNLLEALPLGSFRSVNLVPDSSVLEAWRYWGGAAPNGNWTLAYNASLDFYSFEVASGDAASVSSSPINVVPGQTYTLSCYGNMAAVTAAGSAGVPAATFTYAGGQVVLPVPLGAEGTVHVTFTVPLGVASGALSLSLRGSTGSGPGYFAEPQLEAGALSAYQASSYLSLANAGATGNSIVVAGFPASVSNLLLPGDNLQIGYRLYKVLEPVASNGSGQATVSIFPYLRDAPAQYTLVQWQMCCGLFRLMKNARSWSTSAVAQWGIHALDFTEAI